MKKFLSLVSALLIVTVAICSNVDKITVYLKNGGVEIISLSQLQGTGFSAKDTSGKENSAISQYFDLGMDSTLFVNINDIDSVTFGDRTCIKAKETSRKIDDELLKYISTYADETISLSKDTPKNLLPSPDEYIYYDDVSDIFPNGLCAVVKAIESDADAVRICVEEVTPDRIFDTYIVDLDFEENGTIEDLSDEEQETRAGSRPSTRSWWFDSNMHRYKMSGNICFGGTGIRYDALTGSLFGKFSVTVDGKYLMHFNHNQNLYQSFKGDTIPIPMSFAGRARSILNPDAKVYLTVNENARSGKLDLELNRKYKVSVCVLISNGDTLLYRPEIEPIDNPSVRFQAEPYLSGKLTVTNNAILNIRPLFHKKGLKLNLSSGPTVKCGLGIDTLKMLTENYLDSVYENASFNITTTLAAKGFITRYEKKTLVESSELKQLSIKKVAAANADGRYFIFPQFEKIETSVESNEYEKFTALSKTSLLSTMKTGVEIENIKTKEIVLHEPEVSSFTPGNISGNELEAKIKFNSVFNASNREDFTRRVLVRYAGYDVKGPETANDECSAEGTPHPHAIDLGLPSGTLWACCHVGATETHGYGKIFQQGSRFIDDTWDDTWEVPTMTQVYELVRNCKWQFTRKNGVIGWWGTGPNGKRLFMPASGYISDDGSGNRYDTDECMVIWSSSINGDGLGWRIYFLEEESIDNLGPYGIKADGLDVSADDESQSYYGAFRLVKKHK